MYHRNGVPYTHNDLRRDNPNVGFTRKALENQDIRTEYGIVEIEIPKSELPPTNIQSVDPEERDGFRASRGNPEFVGDEWRETWDYVEMTWLENRIKAYGLSREQIEFITENGLEAWQSRVAEIKAKYPKS